jgi:hypothetical protein
MFLCAQDSKANSKTTNKYTPGQGRHTCSSRVSSPYDSLAGKTTWRPLLDALEGTAAGAEGRGSERERDIAVHQCPCSVQSHSTSGFDYAPSRLRRQQAGLPHFELQEVCRHARPQLAGRHARPQLAGWLGAPAEADFLASPLPMPAGFFPATTSFRRRSFTCTARNNLKCVCVHVWHSCNRCLCVTQPTKAQH